MVANGILVFWITISLAVLQYSLVIRLASIEHKLFSKIQFVFHYKTPTMNFVAIAKFFYIIYNAIFMSLFAIS